VLKKYKFQGTNQISTELIEAGGEILVLWTEIHKLHNSIWNKKQLSDQWKQSIIVPIHKKGDKADCSIYRQISAINFIQNLPNIILSSLNPYIDEIIGYYQCGIRRNI
jgi:hypothetical protein